MNYEDYIALERVSSIMVVELSSLLILVRSSVSAARLSKSAIYTGDYDSVSSSLFFFFLVYISNNPWIDE